MIISLTDLKRLRAAARYVTYVSMLLEDAVGEPDAVSLKATNDAADVLIEIAEAALALGSELVYMRGPLSERLRDALAKITT